MDKRQLEMDARDARRKKILSHGSDRLAFITGQSQSLSEPDPPSHPLSDVGSLTTDEGDEKEANEPILSTEVESNTPKEAISSPVTETTNNVFSRAMSNPVLKETINTVSASENSRMMCSVIIALFVVTFGFSHKFKPLALVAVADLTIILGRILGRGAGETRIIWRDVGGWTVGGAILLMEVAYAVISDCSLCALIMICAFALQSS